MMMRAHRVLPVRSGGRPAAALLIEVSTHMHVSLDGSGCGFHTRGATLARKQPPPFQRPPKMGRLSSSSFVVTCATIEETTSADMWSDMEGLTWNDSRYRPSYTHSNHYLLVPARSSERCGAACSAAAQSRQ